MHKETISTSQVETPLIHALVLADFDGCLTSTKEKFYKPVLTAVKSALGGEDKLKKSIEKYPFIQSYFPKKNIDCFHLENRLIELVVKKIEPLMQKLSLGEKAGLTSEIVKSILNKSEIVSIFSEIKEIENSQKIEIIYRIALLKSASDNIVISNQALLCYIKNKVDNIHQKFPDSKIIITLACSSNRQSSYLDIINYEKNLNGLVGMQFLFFYQYGFRQIFLGTDYIVQLCPLLLADLLLEFKVGESLFYRNDLDDKDLKPAIKHLISDPKGSKIFLVSNLISILAATPVFDQLPKKIFAFMFDDDPLERGHTKDDKYSIFHSLYNYLLTNPYMLPINACIDFFIYCNLQQLEIIHYASLKGRGNIHQLVYVHDQLIQKIRRKKQEKLKIRHDINTVLGNEENIRKYYPSYQILELKTQPNFKLNESFYSRFNLISQIEKENKKFWSAIDRVRKNIKEVKLSKKISPPIFEEFSLRISREYFFQLKNLAKNLNLEETNKSALSYFQTEQLHIFFNNVLNLDYLAFSVETNGYACFLYFENETQKLACKIRIQQLLVNDLLKQHISTSSAWFSLIAGKVISQKESEYVVNLNNLVSTLNLHCSGLFCDSYNKIMILYRSLKEKSADLQTAEKLLIELLCLCHTYLIQLKVKKPFYQLSIVEKQPSGSARSTSQPEIEVKLSI